MIARTAPSTTGPRIEVACLSHSPSMTQDPGGAAPFRAAGAALAARLADYAPTLVFYVAPDHRRALTEVLPCFTIPITASGFGDWGTPADDYDVASDQAAALIAYLLARDIDVAVAPQLKLDHGFGLTMVQLFGSLGAVPVVPVVINCIGSPRVSMRRTATLGAALGDFSRALGAEERVLILASGGLSHSPPNLMPGWSDLDADGRVAAMALAKRNVAPDWDRAALARFAAADWDALAAMSDVDMARGGPGGDELRTWLAAATAGGRPLTTLSYQPEDEWLTGMAVAATPGLIAS